MVTYPEDWREVKLGEALVYTQPTNYIENNYVEHGVVPVLTAGKSFILGYSDKTDSAYKNLPAILFDDFTTEVRYLDYPFMVKSSATKFLNLKSDYYDIKYLYYWLDKLKFQIEAHERHWISRFSKFNVVLPSLQEQQAIASALSDFDEHIDNLTELIEKKKAIRDGALEDLVSGRTRLDGFNGEWISVKLSDFAQINPSSALPEVFKYVDLESVKGITLMGWRVERKETAPSRAKRLAQFGDIFFQTVRPYQRNNYLFELSDEDVVFSTGYAQLRTKNDARFLFLLLRQDDFVNEVLDNCTGTSYPAINPSKLSDIKIYVPIDKNEQQAIAEVLTAMDEEIESLKIEKEKMIQIKEGAMDDLLTGRVRLKV